MRVLITDGDNRAALAVTRALGRRGHEVFVGERRRPALAQTSRFCARAFQYPDPTTAEQAFIDCLQEIVRRESVDVLLPVADVATMLIAEQRELFEPYCRIPCPDAATLSRVADKADLVRMAKELAVPTPNSWILESGSSPLPDSLTYPVVLKPHRSRVRTESGWKACSVGYAADADGLRAAVGSRKSYEFPIILQERISGPGLGVFLCFSHGAVVARFCHRRLREKPPWGGVSVLAESIPVHPDAMAYAERLLRAYGWTGVAMVEFKVDDRDGTPRLMEINGRFWGSLQLAIDAGVDFPNILLDTFDAPRDGVTAAYRVGVRCRWFWGDVDSFLLGLRGLNGDWRLRANRATALGRFIKLWGRDLYYDNPKPYDMRPWVHETARWIKR